MSPETERLIKMLESLPTEQRLIGGRYDPKASEMVGGEMVDVVRPSYLLASDRDFIVGALKFVAS